MSPNPIMCAATPAALAHHVAYVQQIIEDSYAGSITVVKDLPIWDDHSGNITSYFRDLDADTGRTYSIWAYVSPPVNGEGQLRLYVDVEGDGHSYGEIRLTTDPVTDSTLVSLLNTIAEINEKQNY